MIKLGTLAIALVFSALEFAPMAVGVGFSQAGGKNSSVRVGIAGEF